MKSSDTLTQTALPDNRFANIPDSGFKSTNEDTHTDKVSVRIRTRATFQFSKFSAIQFLMGLSVMTASKRSITAELMAKLIAFLTAPADEVGLDVVLNRTEVVQLRTYLEARMSHCEHERDNRSAAFNPGTYIAQKFLLLDLREWLMCEPA